MCIRDRLYIKVKVEDCEDIIEQSILGDQVVDRLVYRDKDGTPYQRQDLSLIHI